MQIVCESCGATGTAASIDVVGSEVHVTCAACGHASAVGAATAEEATSAPAAQDPVPEPQEAVPAASLPPTKCPKCGHRQHDTVACHKCGLVFARARKRGQRPWEAAPPGKEEAVAKAKLLWAEVEVELSDGAHQAFVDYARLTGIGTWAAMRYRHWLADHPSDALAKTHMDLVVADAQAIATALSSTGTSDSYAANAKKVRMALVIVVILMCMGIVAIGARLVGAGNVTPF
jgi:hypothetical protein